MFYLEKLITRSAYINILLFSPKHHDNSFEKSMWFCKYSKEILKGNFTYDSENNTVLKII